MPIPSLLLVEVHQDFSYSYAVVLVEPRNSVWGHCPFLMSKNTVFVCECNQLK